jgi:hypothetical protein
LRPGHIFDAKKMPGLHGRRDQDRGFHSYFLISGCA